MNKTVFDLDSVQKRGAVRAGNHIEYLIGALILVVIATSLAPTMFSNTADLGNTTLNPSVPTWVPTVMYVIIGAGLVFLIWKGFGNS